MGNGIHNPLDKEISSEHRGRYKLIVAINLWDKRTTGYQCLEHKIPFEKIWLCVFVNKTLLVYNFPELYDFIKTKSIVLRLHTQIFDENCLTRKFHWQEQFDIVKANSESTIFNSMKNDEVCLRNRLFIRYFVSIDICVYALQK